jgi:hypothetical protein
MKLKHAKEDALIWLEKWSHNLNKTRILATWPERGRP